MNQFKRSRFSILPIAGLLSTCSISFNLAADDGIKPPLPQIEQPSSLAPVVVVTGSRHSKDDALINDLVTLEDLAISPNSITEMLAEQPGLAANGQPGIFQTVNIRGLARQRVHAYVNGMRITSERRAGVAASFVDPYLLGSAEVTQGPASTYYGSGALAGSIHLATRQEDHLWMNAGYGTDGDEWVTALGHGTESYAASIAYRTRNNGETIDSEVKNNHFSQRSLNFIRHFELGEYSLDWQVIESKGTDIGKDNSRFPDNRITDYPEEKHLLSQLTLSGKTNWVGRLYWHDQTLITQDLRPQNRINRVNTDSTDIGFSLENEWSTDNLSGLYGFDYFGRRGVNSLETEQDLNSAAVDSFKALDDGQENESAVFFTVNQQLESWSIHAGLRANYQSQKSALSNSISDNFSTYFATIKKQLGDFETQLSFGTGFRFASLSERLFSGTTGRGQTIGNPDLAPEESKAWDLGLIYSIDSVKAEAHVFYTDIDNFIERVSIDNDTRTYQNVINGKLEGWQYDLNIPLRAEFSIGLKGQGVKGVDNAGNWLSDIPATRHSIQLRFDNADWSSQLSYTKRKAKEKFGDGEILLDSANLVDFKLGYRFNNEWRMQFLVKNLLDERYFNSADDLGTLASGRNFGVNISFN